MKRLLMILTTIMCTILTWAAMPDGFTFYTKTNGVSTAFTALPEAYRCAIGIAWNSTQRTNASEPTAIGAGIPTDYQGDFIIPSFLKDQAYYVKEIGYKAFYKCEGLTSVSIPSSITYIDVNAFNYCTGLTEVTIPGSVITIDQFSFACCHNLKTLNLQEGIQNIESEAFIACKSITALDIPSSVKKIGSKAFGGAQINHNNYGYGSYEGCDNLTKVIVHWDEPISIYTGTFSNAANATLYVPKGKIDLYANAEGWKEFKEIKETPIIFADETVKSICVDYWDTDGDGELSEDEAAEVTSLNRAFRKSKIQTFDELKYFTGLTSIYTEAFEDCSNLTTITIPNNVKSLDKQAFSRCYNLVNIGFSGSLETIGVEVFGNCTGLITFNVPNGVKTITSTAFSGCSNLTSITIPASVSYIGGTPFNGCLKLTSIIVDSNNEVYESPAGSNAIIEKTTHTLVAGCKNTIIPESVVTIGNNAFLNCSLSSLIIPGNVTAVGNYAFSDSNLSSVTLSEGLKTIGEKSFYNCNRLNNIILPNSLTTIGVSAFEGCTSISSINIPCNVTTIGGLAFSGCTNLSSIVIPNNVTTIGGSIFNGCTNLKTAIIEGGTIGYQQFYGCKNLESVHLNDGLTTINNNAFIGCTSLTSIILPRTVTAIGSAAFSDCNNLLLVVSENENPTQINDAAFYGINSNARLQVPEGTKSKYEAILGWKNYFNEIVDDGNVPEVYTLTIKVDGLGTVNYDGNVIRNSGSSFYIIGGKPAKLVLSADNTNGLENVKVNNRDVTSSVNNNLYTIDAITSDTNIEVKFEFPEYSDGQTFEVNYSFAQFVFKVISASDKTCELYLAYCNEDNVDVIVPSSIYGYRVIGIGDGAFEDEDDMESITLPPTISYIGKGAFDDGGTVNDVYISDLEAWCKISFADSYSAPSRGNIWLNDKKIVNLEIPKGVTNINNYAFYGMSCIQSVYIPEGIESIGANAFNGCNNLSSVTVCITEPIAIESTVFSNRANATLYVPIENKVAYQSADNWKEFKGLESFVNFADVNVKAVCIANWDTNGDGKLSETEAAAVTDLGQVFKGNTQIVSFDEFKYFTGLKTVNSSDFNGCESLTSIAIPSSITLIGAMAFESCMNLTAVHITDMGAWCKIYFENNPLWYAKHLFLNGTEIKDLVIPDGVKSISGWAFSFWSNLTSVTIPKSVTFIGENAFDGCAGLTTVSIDNSVLEIEKEAFKDCNNLKTLQITDVASWCESQIAPYGNPLRNTHSLYVNDKEVKELVIPEGVTSINLGVFDGYSALASVTIPSSVETIGMGAFNGCSNLLEIYCLAETTPSIEDDPCFKTQTATLHVPNTSLEAYKTADYWKKFKFIVGLDDVVTESDHIYSDGLSIYQGYTANLEIKLANENTLTAYQFDLVLPEGIALATNENGKYLVSKSDRYSDNTQQVKVEKHDNNTYRIMSISMQNGIINGNDGIILTITLKADEEITVGNANAEIRDIVLTLPNEMKIKTRPVTFSIDVNKRLKGDADGDGEIDVTDIVAMINYIMGQPSDKFVMPAADLNDDGEVDIFDVMKAINLVLSQKKSTRSYTSSTRGSEEQAILKATDDRIIFGINDASRFTAFQFDVEVTNGAELSVRLNANAHHNLQFVRTDQDSYKVICVSMDNSTLTANGNDLVEFILSKKCDAQISNIVFVTPEETKIHFAGNDVNLTGIGSISIEQSETIFDLSGRKIDVERSRLPEGIYIINNKKVVIK